MACSDFGQNIYRTCKDFPRFSEPFSTLKAGTISKAEMFEKIGEIARLGITVLLVEQEVGTFFAMTIRKTYLGL